MLQDGIKLLGTSSAENFTITSGTTLPVGAQGMGELFYKTGVGLHVYDGSAWVLVGSGTWGTITGTLSNQTDLTTVLSSKADLSSGHIPLSQLASGTAAAGKYLAGDGTWTTLPVGSGTVSAVSVTSANGVSGTVATSTTTPAITLVLGNITPNSVAASGTMAINGVAISSQPLAIGSGNNQHIRLITTADGNYYDIGRTSGQGRLVFFGNAAGTAYDFLDSNSNALLTITSSSVNPGVDNARSLGTSSLKWTNVYANTFTGSLAGGATGSLVVQTGAGATGFIAAGTSGYVLTSTGTGSAPTWQAAGTGSGTVSTVSITTANGVSGSVANATTAPAITLTLGAITPSSVTSSGVISTATGFAMPGTTIVSNTTTYGGGAKVFQPSQANTPGVVSSIPSGTSKGTGTYAVGDSAYSNGVYIGLETTTSGLYTILISSALVSGVATSASGKPLVLSVGSNSPVIFDTNGNSLFGPASGITTSALATSATNGFPYVPTAAGTPTGTPTAYTGRAPLMVDSTNGLLYFYSGGSWKTSSGGGSSAAGTLTGTTLASNVVNASISALTANAIAVGSQTGAVAAPTSITLDGSYASSATPSNMQSKFNLFKQSTDSYGFGVSNDSGMWYHAGNTASTIGTVGYHQWASQGVARMRLTPNGNLYVGSGTASTAATTPLQIERNQAGITRVTITNTDTSNSSQADIGFMGSSGFGLFTGLVPSGTAADATVSSANITTNDAYAFTSSTTHRYGIFTNQARRFTITAAGDLVVGSGALTTTATAGFLNIAGVAGVPTGTPTSFTGRAPITVDTTNNALYFYSNGAWRTTATATNITGGAGGSLPYQSAASTTTTLPIGTVGKVLTSTGTVPAWTAPIYDLALSINGKPSNSATVLAFTAVRAFTLPASFTGSVSKSGVSATASSVFTVNKNGTSIGTITFAAAGSTGTFAGAGGTFAVSDLLTIVAPASSDSTLADIGLTIVAQLT